MMISAVWITPDLLQLAWREDNSESITIYDTETSREHSFESFEVAHAVYGFNLEWIALSGAKGTMAELLNLNAAPSRSRYACPKTTCEETAEDVVPPRCPVHKIKMVADRS